MTATATTAASGSGRTMRAPLTARPRPIRTRRHRPPAAIGATTRAAASSSSQSSSSAATSSPSKEDSSLLYEVSTTADRIKASKTVAISDLATEMKREGKDVISLAPGEPDFATPERIARAGQDAIATGRTKYSPNPGIADLREAIVRKLERENGIRGLSAGGSVVVTNGAKQAIAETILASCSPGDGEHGGGEARFRRDEAGGELPPHGGGPSGRSHGQVPGPHPVLPQQPHRRRVHEGGPRRHRGGRRLPPSPPRHLGRDLRAHLLPRRRSLGRALSGLLCFVRRGRGREEDRHNRRVLEILRHDGVAGGLPRGTGAHRQGRCQGPVPAHFGGIQPGATRGLRGPADVR